MKQSQLQRELLAFVPRLRRFAYALTGSQSDGDDLVQATCERALRNAQSFREGTRMDSWLYRIAQNFWIDECRKKKQRGETIDPDKIDLSDEGSGAALPQNRMILARVREAMGHLPEEQRLVLTLVAIEGQSYRETSSILDIPIGTVMSRLARARANLTEMLGEGRQF